MSETPAFVLMSNGVLESTAEQCGVPCLGLMFKNSRAAKGGLATMSGHTAFKLSIVVVGPELQAKCSEAQNQERWSYCTTFVEHQPAP